MSVPRPRPTATAAPEPALLDVPTVAQYLGITERMAQRLVYERRLPVVKVGKFVYVPRSALEDWITSNTTSPQNGGQR